MDPRRLKYQTEVERTRSGSAKGLLVLAFIICVMSLPVQGIAECVYWLKNGEWSHYSILDAMPIELVVRIWEMEWIGLQSLIVKAIQVWVSVPVFLLAFVLGYFLD